MENGCVLGLWSAQGLLDPSENQRHRLELGTSDRKERCEFDSSALKRKYFLIYICSHSARRPPQRAGMLNFRSLHSLCSSPILQCSIVLIVSARRLQHERPQTKDHHDFGPRDEPRQVDAQQSNRKSPRAAEHTFTQLCGICSRAVRKSGTSRAAAGWTPSTLYTWRTRWLTVVGSGGEPSGGGSPTCFLNRSVCVRTGRFWFATPP